jgi:prepilin-type N-terminal cleavage/methylation domain-containing protein
MKSLNRGFTLLEGMILLAIFAIVVAVAIGPVTSSGYSYGAMGVVEQRCISGYLHSISSTGNVQQVLNQNGGGIPCN